MSPLLPVLAALAWSAPGPAELPLDGAPPLHPVSTRTGLSAALLGGLDRWGTGGGASGELQLGMGWARQGAGLTLEAGGSTLLQGWRGPWGLDAHGLGLTVSGGAWGAELGATGSVAQGWMEGRLLPRWRQGGRRAEIVLGAGPAVRGWTGGATPGLVAQVSARQELHGRVWTWAHVQGRTWVGPELPAVLWANAGVEISPTLNVDVGLTGGVGVAAGGAGGLQGGLLASGARVVRGQLSAAWWWMRGVAVVAEVGPELGMGALPYQRVRAMLGVRGSRGRMRSVQPDVPPQVVLRFDAPASAKVEVTGSFTGWIPVAMEHGPRGWTLALEVPSGMHEYVYLVDGQPVVPPEATQRRDDGFGGLNGVLVVQP